MSAIGKRNPWFWAAVIGCYFALWLLFGRHQGVFFSGDQGLKYLQIRSLAEGSLGIDYPGKALDPRLDYLPLSSYHLKFGENIVSMYLGFFILLAVPFYLAGGWLGLYLLPCLIAVLTLFLAFRVSSSLAGFSPRLAVLLLGFCSPLFFLSMVLQELTLCALFLVAAVAALSGAGGFEFGGRRSWLAGLFLGLAILSRQEAVLLALAWLLAVFLIDKKLKSVAGGLGGIIMVVVPYLLLELALWGEIVELKRYEMVHYWYDMALSQWLRMRLAYLYQFLFGAVTMTGEVRRPFLALPFVLLPAVALVPRLVKNRYLPAAGVLLLFPAVAGLLFGVVFRNLWVRGLFYATPYLVLAAFFLRPIKGSTPAKFLLSVSAFYFLFVIITAPNEGGLQWGPRYLVPVYPCLVLVAGFCWGNRAGLSPPKLRKLILIAGGILAVAGLLVQLEGLARLYDKKSDRAIERVMEEAGTGTWITYLFYFPQEAAARYFDNRIYFFWPTRDSLSGLIEKLDESGGEGFALVGHDGRLIERDLQPLIESTTAFRRTGEVLPFRIYDLSMAAVCFRRE